MLQPPHRTARRLNRWAVAALAIFATALGAATLALRLAPPARIGDQVARQVERLVADGRTDLALRHLGRYLGLHPEDLEMRFLQARLLAERARDVASMDQAARLHDQLLRRHPDHPEADEARFRLVGLYLSLSEAVRDGDDSPGGPEQGAFGSRYRAAARLARGLVDRRGDDPRAHVLLARALEGLAVADGRDELDGAVASYGRALALHELALRRDPDDEAAARGAVDVAARLAVLHRDRLDAPEAAEAVLDRLVAALPGAVAPLLVRYRDLRESRDEPRAAAALSDALGLAPDDPGVRLIAAEHALQRGDPAAARAHLDAIPGGDERAGPMPIRLIRGLIELDEGGGGGRAMEQWRAGLVLANGNDAELTWWLAYVLIGLGNLTEADPLIDHYRRLSGGDDGPSYRLLLALRDLRRGAPLVAARALEDLCRDPRASGRVRDEAILALGRCHEALGDHEQASRLYQLAAQSDRRSARPVVARVELLRRWGRPEEAALLLEQALQGPNADDPASRGRAVADPAMLLLLAELRLAEQAGRPPSQRSWDAFDAAIRRAEDAIRLAAEAEGVPPRSRELTLLRVDRDVLDGHLDRADDRLREALETWPGDARLWADRAELMARDGRPDEAIALLDRGRQVSGDVAALRLTLARILVAQGRGREAQRRLVDGDAGLPSGHRAALWEALGRLRAARGDDEGARAAFSRWAELMPHALAPRQALFDVALATGRTDDAEALLEGLRGEPDGADGLPFRLARAALLLRQAGQQQGPRAEERRGALLLDAQGAVDGALDDARELAAAHLLRGRILEARGLVEEAATAYRQSWRRGDASALPRLADLLARLGRFDELERLAGGVGADAGAARLSAAALLSAGEVGRASRLVASAVDDAEAPAAALAWRARMLDLAGRRDELEALLRRDAERAGPDQPGPWLDLVAAQARHGRGRAALDITIRRALERTRSVPAPLMEARLRWAAGDVRAADEALEGAVAGPIADPTLVVGAASYYQETGRPDLAEPLLERLAAVEDLADAAALQLAMLLSRRAAGDPATWARALDLVGPESGDPDRRLARAVVLARSPDPGRRDGAVALFEALMADLPVMHPRAVEARNQLARLLIEFGRGDRAARVTAVSADQPSPAPSAIALHARALLLAGRPAEAAEELDRLELIRPGDPEAAGLRAEQLLRVGDGDPAGLERVVADRLGSPGGDLLARAAVLSLVGVGSFESVEAAGRIADRLGERSPEHGWASGLVLAVRGRSDEALDRCASALDALDPTDGVDRNGLADAAVLAVSAVPADSRREAAGRARPILDALLARRPGDPDLLIASAILRHHLGDFEAEAGLYRQALERRPGDAHALYNLALLLSEGLERPEQALELIDRLADRLGPLPGVLGARGVILARLGRLDEAIRDLGRSVELEPTADRHYELARAYHKAGRDDRARGHLEQARRAGLDAGSLDRWQHDEFRRLLSP